MASQSLMKAYQLIKSGQKAEAEARLRAYLESDANNADAWWLLANAATDPASIREALERDLNLRPDHAIAKNALAALNRKYPSPVAEANEADDDFDSLFAEEYVERSPSTRPVKSPRKPGQSNQNWILYGSLALMVLFVCGGIGAIMMEATRVVTGVVTSEEFSEMQAILSEVSGYQQVPDDAYQRGNISVGERKAGTVDTFEDELWTFEGRAGQVIIIEVNALDGFLDPQLFLFHPNGQVIAANDDYDMSLDARIRAVLPANGRYSIVVSAFVSGGDYEMFLYSAN